ncbi:MAG: hypothetical protein PHC62_01010 [Candidatus Izemoplasmatales bacterium]|nr:hypothetical protein [Candidatus Izemoplasmatales bacterium]
MDLKHFGIEEDTFKIDWHILDIMVSSILCTKYLCEERNDESWATPYLIFKYIDKDLFRFLSITSEIVMEHMEIHKLDIFPENFKLHIDMNTREYFSCDNKSENCIILGTLSKRKYNIFLGVTTYLFKHIVNFAKEYQKDSCSDILSDDRMIESLLSDSVFNDCIEAKMKENDNIFYAIKSKIIYYYRCLMHSGILDAMRDLYDCYNGECKRKRDE